MECEIRTRSFAEAVKHYQIQIKHMPIFKNKKVHEACHLLSQHLCNSERRTCTGLKPAYITSHQDLTWFLLSVRNVN